MLKTLVKRVMDTRNASAVGSALGAAKEYSDTQLPKVVAEAVKSIADERGLSKTQVFGLFYEINRTLYPEFVINDRDRMMLRDQEFRDYFTKFCADNWTSFERKWNVRGMLRLLPNVPGNLAECGVYTGGTSLLLCEFAEKHSRQVHLFDSFEGLSEPSSLDGTHWAKGNLTASEALVHQNLAQFHCFQTFKGWIPDAFPAVADQRYAFLHVDVDLEQPTRDSLEFFYPKMNKGGVIVLDDHGYDTCPGARKAALDYMSDKPEPVIDLSTGQGLIIKQ